MHAGIFGAGCEAILELGLALALQVMWNFAYNKELFENSCLHIALLTVETANQ